MRARNRSFRSGRSPARRRSSCLATTAADSSTPIPPIRSRTRASGRTSSELEPARAASRAGFRVRPHGRRLEARTRPAHRDDSHLHGRAHVLLLGRDAKQFGADRAWGRPSARQHGRKGFALRAGWRRAVRRRDDRHRNRRLERRPRIDVPGWRTDRHVQSDARGASRLAASARDSTACWCSRSSPHSSPP